MTAEPPTDPAERRHQLHHGAFRIMWLVTAIIAQMRAANADVNWGLPLVSLAWGVLFAIGELYFRKPAKPPGDA